MAVHIESSANAGSTMRNEAHSRAPDLGPSDAVVIAARSSWIDRMTNPPPRTDNISAKNSHADVSPAIPHAAPIVKPAVRETTAEISKPVMK